MKEYGTVVKLKGEFAQVRIGRNSACGACGKCGMTEKQKYVDFFTQNTLNANIGDQVELEIYDNVNTSQLAFMGYILPLIPAIVALFVALKYLNELWATLFFFAGFFLGLAVVAIVDKAKKRKWISSPKMTRIILENSKNIQQEE